MIKELEHLKGTESYYKLVEEIRKEIIEDMKKLVKNSQRKFSLNLKIGDGKAIHIDKISRYGMIEKFDDKTDVVHSFDKLSLDLLAVLFDCFKHSIDDKDARIEKVMDDLAEKMGEREY